MATNRNAKVDADKLLPRIIQDIKHFQQENGTVGPTLVEVLDAYLRWHGIVGYTAQILSIVEAAE